MRAESLDELLRAESLNIRRVLKESHNVQALYEPADPDQPATVWGLLIFLPAAFAAAGLASFWMYRLRHPHSERMLLSGPRHQREAAPYTPRPYSLFDLIASCGTGFLINLGITIIVPVALASAETRGHSSPLTASGLVAGSTSIGMVVSVVLMYPWPFPLMDTKLPFLVFAVLMLAGNLAFLGVEWLELPAPYLLSCRVLMALGFGAGYAAKRRAGIEPEPKRREYLFMLLELACSVGMASGPLLTGGLALLLPHRSLLIPPAVTSLLSLAFLLALLLCPLDAPFHFSLSHSKPQAAPGHEAGAGPPRAQAGLARTTPPGTPSHGGMMDREMQREMQATPPVYGARASAPPAEGTPLVQSPAAAAAAAAAPPPLWVAATVQVTCLLFGVTRNFLKFGFESAMVCPEPHALLTLTDRVLALAL